MLPHFPSEMTIHWNVTRLTIAAGVIERPRCRRCRSTLGLHQPDEARPEHLLGTCDRCGDWYLVEVGGESEAYIVDLPNVALIREAVATTAGTDPGRERSASGSGSRKVRSGPRARRAIPHPPDAGHGHGHGHGKLLS